MTALLASATERCRGCGYGPRSLALTVCVLTAVLTLAACGDDGDPTARTAATASPDRGEAAPNRSTGGTGGRDGQKDDTDASRPANGDGETVSNEEHERELEQFGLPDEGGDDSIQTYGEVVEDREEQEIVDAMLAYLRAMASGNYEAVCGALLDPVKERIVTFRELAKNPGGCPGFVREVLPRAREEAREAAAGEIAGVRSEDGSAFVLFTPRGGSPSYFVMKREGSDWKATGLNTGGPLNPLDAASETD